MSGGLSTFVETATLAGGNALSWCRSGGGFGIKGSTPVRAKAALPFEPPAHLPSAAAAFASVRAGPIARPASPASAHPAHDLAANIASPDPTPASASAFSARVASEDPPPAVVVTTFLGSAAPAAATAAASKVDVVRTLAGAVAAFGADSLFVLFDLSPPVPGGVPVDEGGGELLALASEVTEATGARVLLRRLFVPEAALEDEAGPEAVAAEAAEAAVAMAAACGGHRALLLAAAMALPEVGCDARDFF